MGRGRTTTGMVIATLVYLNRIGSSGSIPTFFTSITFYIQNNIIIIQQYIEHLIYSDF